MCGHDALAVEGLRAYIAHLKRCQSFNLSHDLFFSSWSTWLENTECFRFSLTMMVQLFANYARNYDHGRMQRVGGVAILLSDHISYRLHLDLYLKAT